MSRRHLLTGVAGLAVLGSMPIAQALSPLPLRPGARLVWRGGAASIPGTNSQIAPDANGGWVDEQTGERYSEFDTPGAAGAGYVVIDVLAANGDSYLLWVSILLSDGDFGAANSFIDANGLIAGADNIADYWVSPQRLDAIADTDQPDLRVLRMPYRLNGKSFRAIRIQNRSRTGWSQHTYDLDSGLGIATGSTTQGGPVSMLGAGNTITQGEGNTQLTFTRLAGTRHTGLPGAGEAYPDRIAAYRRFDYSGTRTVAVQGAQDFSVPVALRYDVLANEGAYLRANLGIAGVAGSRERIIPAGVIGALWMNPETLAEMTDGGSLDHDRITGVTATCLGHDGNLITLALRARHAQHAFSYDLRSGLLVAADLRQQNGLASDILTVRLDRAR
jgi:hypothetical protein